MQSKKINAALCAGLLVTFVIAAGCTTVSEPSARGAPAARAMQPADMTGTWMPMKNAMGGKAMELPSGFELKIEGERYFAGVPPSYGDAGRIEFVASDGTGTVRYLDIKSEKGQTKGRTIPAIARMNGNQLEVVYDMEQKARPTEFVSRDGTQHFHVIYTRK
jgi:uncharacterized protein (TIGR03067 family)